MATREFNSRSNSTVDPASHPEIHLVCVRMANRLCLNCYDKIDIISVSESFICFFTQVNQSKVYNLQVSFKMILS